MTLTYTNDAAHSKDAEMRQALEVAHIPTLLATLAYATGENSLLRQEFAPNYVLTPLGFEPQGGLSPEAQVSAREAAQEVIKRMAKGEYANRPAPSETEVRTIMEHMLGSFSDEEFSLLLHEFGLPGDIDAPSWQKSQIAPKTTFSVAIIGAGMAGIGAAYRLKQAGIPFVILERRAEAGGVWSENSYPGCRLDTSNFGYSYSYHQNPNWDERYSKRASVLSYLQESAEEFGLLGNMRFGTEVVSALFDEEKCTWNLTLANDHGAVETMQVQALISAVGQLNQPNYPALENLDAFSGPSWHTARWNHDVDLTAKRVAIIGTGSSGFQAAQEIAKTAGEVTIFQRTPPWVSPTPGYNSPLKDGERWLLENLPNYHNWTRVYGIWAGMGRRPFTEVDPNWNHPISVSENNEKLRQVLLAYLEESFGDRPDLLEKMRPSYPPYAKRILRDDGTWSATLKRPNVKLISDKIKRVVETGIEIADGTVQEFDALVYGTGFRAAEFLSTVSITGKDGITLKEQWHGDDARAFYGITIPNFPNFFCVYGPNTNINGNASVVLLAERSATYIVDCIRALLESGHRTMEVRQESFDEYNERIDAASETVVYGASAVNSWYKNAQGRLTQNWPLPTIEFFKATQNVNAEDYNFS